MPRPLLILGDSPTAPTGLGHIACDIAGLIHEFLPNYFRVATVGCGAPASRKLPFQQYTVPVRPDHVVPELPTIWKDFAGEERGIILAIWNPGWLGWLLGEGLELYPDLKKFIVNTNLELWVYAPVDGHCDNGGLPSSVAKVLYNFDRVLPYTAYGKRVMEASGLKVSDPLPHGISRDVYWPRDKAEARKTFINRINGMQVEMRPDMTLVGVVATNSARKDWYLAFKTCAELLRRGIDVGLWAHADTPKKIWDLEELAWQFGMNGRLMVSTRNLSNEDMALAYSACDVTLAIGSGEGWGYPIAESLACGVPVVHGNYAGGAEMLTNDMLVPPIGCRGEGLYAIQRPVFTAMEWATAVTRVIRNSASRKPVLPEYIYWDQAWPKWKEWLLEGIANE